MKVEPIDYRVTFDDGIDDFHIELYFNEKWRVYTVCEWLTIDSRLVPTELRNKEKIDFNTVDEALEALKVWKEKQDGKN